MAAPEAAVDNRDRILDSTVDLLIRGGVGAVHADTICATAGVDRPEFDRWFDSLASIYVAVTARLLDSHVDNPDGAVQVTDDLEAALRTAIGAVWDMTELRIDEHHAIHVLSVAQAADQQLLADMGFSLHDTHLRVAEHWLAEVERTYRIEWDVPAPQLAVLIQATLDGLLVDYLSSRDGRQIREVLDVFAGHLAGHALPR